jgi:hypothetical protein
LKVIEGLGSLKPEEIGNSDTATLSVQKVFPDLLT